MRLDSIRKSASKTNQKRRKNHPNSTTEFVAQTPKIWPFFKKKIGGIPYTALGAQIPPTPLIFYFCLFFIFTLILGYVRLSKGQVCPAGLGKRFSEGPAELEPPSGDRNRKKRRIKNTGWGVICAPRAQHRRVPICLLADKQTEFLET